MGLKLNELPQIYEEFCGKGLEQMPKLIAEGRVPMSVVGLMQARLDVRNSSDDVKSAWMDNCFNTGDAIVYHPDGRAKIVLDSQYLREMTTETPLRDAAALVLTQEQYGAMDGEEFQKGELGKTDDYWFSKKDVKAHPVWRILARDQALLDDYTDYIFSELKGKKGNVVDDIGMGIFSSPKIYGDTPEIRAWDVTGIFRSSTLGDRGGFNIENGCLVGILSKSESVLEKAVA